MTCLCKHLPFFLVTMTFYWMFQFTKKLKVTGGILVTVYNIQQWHSVKSTVRKQPQGCVFRVGLSKHATDETNSATYAYETHTFKKVPSLKVLQMFNFITVLKICSFYRNSMWMIQAYLCDIVDLFLHELYILFLNNFFKTSSQQQIQHKCVTLYFCLIFLPYFSSVFIFKWLPHLSKIESYLFWFLDHTETGFPLSPSNQCQHIIWVRLYLS